MDMDNDGEGNNCGLEEWAGLEVAKRKKYWHNCNRTNNLKNLKIVNISELSVLL